jgi:hypothetical protein
MSTSGNRDNQIIVVARACNTYGSGQLNLMHRALVDGEGVMAQYGNKSFNLDPSGLTSVDVRSTPEISATPLKLVSGVIRAPLRVIVSE